MPVVDGGRGQGRVAGKTRRSAPGARGTFRQKDRPPAVEMRGLSLEGEGRVETEVQVSSA